MTIRDKRYFENRINLLVNRGKENSRVIKKLQRQLRALRKKNA